ncbi:hypothetical protein K402DRAFT_136292 [Aulographum hederae CBS 113979]|uniref:Tetratricopeptide repeat domain-containing protein n=1 Tax=Aulographum hederae CBS 113979 TaxID=1176131 RepID=A0A6G1GVG1_9PEZI|nr:hypothetical protein K402DRAFT_136292 [Aulographum hederae CBS 113979]
MLFKSLNLARQSLAKTFSHGFSQSLVAASQTSYAAQNHTFGNFNNRLASNQRDAHQLHNAFHQQQTGVNAKAHDHVDGGLAAYYAVWLKDQKLDDKDWHQFQFTKRIEWHPSANANESEVKEIEESAIEDGVEELPVALEKATVERAYSTSAVDDFRKGFAHEDVEDIAKVDAAIAEEISKAKAAKAEEIVELRSKNLQTPESDHSFVRSPETKATSISEADHYAEQLQSLANGRHYAEIPAVFEQMLASGTKPTAPSYNALLIAAIRLPRGKHQVVPKALDVYSDMLRRKVAPDATTFSILIELLSVRAVDVQAMKKNLEERRARYGGMDEAGKFMFKSNEMEFELLSEDDSLPLAVKFFDMSSTLHTKAVLPDAAYHALIIACAQADKVDDMVRVYSKMEFHGVIPHGNMFVPMITAFAQSGDLRSAVECYDEYKALAIANDNGEVSIDRKDFEVYAALIRAYMVCGKNGNGEKFFEKIQTGLSDPQLIQTLQDGVGSQAVLVEMIKQGSFEEALTEVKEHLTPRARDAGLIAVCISAADANNQKVATEAFHFMSDAADVSTCALAMGAMYVRSGNIEAANSFWQVIERSPFFPEMVESTVMHTVALIGGGHFETGLRQSRVMFSRMRDASTSSNQAKTETVEQIDEGIEVIGQFLTKRGIMLPAKACMELMWTMVENGGIVSPVATHLLAGLGVDGIAQVGFEDLNLLIQVQSGMILNGPSQEIANTARFTHLLEVLYQTGVPTPAETVTVAEKALTKLERTDLASRWQQYRYTVSQPAFSPVQYQQSFVTPATPTAPSFEESYDPYAVTTDNKGSVAITDLLDKPHGRSSSHLNEALNKFKNMRRAGRHPRFFIYAKLIAAAAKEDRLTLAHDILNLAKQDVPLMPQYRIVRYGWVTILDAMVAACLTTGQRHLASQYHQDLLEMGAAPSANTFGLYITTLKESTKTFDEATEAVKIFLRAKSEGVEPSSFLYNALIGKLGKARRIDDCLFYFAEMRHLGIRPTSVTYGTIVNALCRVSDEKFAEELFEEMESMPNYKPRPAPYHSMMQFFLTTKRDRSKVLNYYERMRAKNIQPTTHTYKLLIDTHATLEPVDMPAAEAVLGQIRQSGEIPEAVHYAALIHAKGCVLHDLDGAKHLFDTVMADRRIRPQACLFQALFEAMNANHQTEGIEPILAQMKASGVEMTPYIANSLIHGWAMAKKIDKARSVYEAVPLEKREPSTYEAMTRAFMTVEDRDAAMSVVNEGLSRGYPTAVANKILELVGGGRTSVLDAPTSS